MKLLSKKSGVLFGAVLAVCAFAVPMASAASWSGGGSVTHQLASTNLTFTETVGGVQVGSSCALSTFDADVVSAAVVEITGGRFDNCTGTNGGAGCSVTATPTRFPWTATAPNTTNIQIHGVHVDVTFSGFCLVSGQAVTLTGTLTGGSFDPSAIGADRRITFDHDDGLVGHSSLGSATAFVTGSFRDLTGTANLFD